MPRPKSKTKIQRLSRFLGYTSFDINKAVILFLLGLLIFLLVGFLLLRTDLLTDNYYDITLGRVVLLGMIAPLFEEPFYRGLIFAQLARGFNPVLAAILSSFLFALASGPQWGVMLYAFLFGLYLCYMHYKLKSIIPGIMLHLVFNMIEIFVRV